MIGWLLIAALGAAILYFTVKFVDEDEHFGICMGGCILGCILILAGLAVAIIGPIEYHQWEASFNLLKSYIESNSNNYSFDSIKRVIDIAKANEQLFAWQAGRMTWDIFSCASKSVLELLPII